MSVEAFMLSYFESRSPGAKFVCPAGNYHTTIHAIGYIDDNNLLINQRGIHDNTDIKIAAQRALEDWSDVLSVTGGSLSHEKCFSYTMVRQLNTSCSKYKLQTDKFQVKGDDGTQYQIRQQHFNKAEKYLGIHSSPSGSWDTQFLQSIKDAKQFGIAITASALNGHEVKIAYQEIWRAKIRCTLTNVWFSSRQCQELQSHVLHHVLPKMHMNRCFPRAILHGPPRLGGLGFPKHYHEQGFLSIQQIVGRLWRKDHQATLILISLHIAQLESGTSASILGHIDHIPPYITDAWVLQVWNFLHEHKLSINVKEIQLQQLRRQNDQYIMDVFNLHCSKPKLKILNKCRMYMRVILISDIARGDGIGLQSGVLQGLIRVHSNLQWPDIEMPSAAEWKVWSWAIRKYLIIDGKLVKKLGSWENTLSHRIHEWTWTRKHQRLYQRDCDRWRYFEPQTCMGHTFNRSFSYTTEYPDDCLPTDVVCTKNHITTLDRPSHRRKIRPKPTNETSQIKLAIQDLPISLRLILGQLYLLADDRQEIADHLRNNTLMCGSDGSTKNGISSQAFCLHDFKSPNCLAGGAKCPGSPSQQSSLRAETFGALSISVMIKIISQVHNITDENSGYDVYIDNQEVVDRMTTKQFITANDHLVPNYETHQEAISHLKDLPFDGNWQWIRAHTDDTSPAGLLNAEMDR